MAKSYGKYQYETSPRKLEPDYNVPKRPQSKKNTSVKAENNKRKISKKKLKELRKKQTKTVIYVVLGFAIIFAISSRNAKIDQNFAQLSSLKEELETIEKENSQLEVSIESSLNLTNIEQQAKTMLGMQKLTNKQTVYIELPKTDYIEPASEDVIIEKEKNIFEKIGDYIHQLFK